MKDMRGRPGTGDTQKSHQGNQKEQENTEHGKR